MNGPRFWLGKRVELPVYYNKWIQGARFGVVTSYRLSESGFADCLLVKLDKEPRKRFKVWRGDWENMKIVE